MTLPAGLQEAVQLLADGSARRGLAARSSEISAGYRERRPSSTAVASADDVVAYSLSRLPATYAACEQAFSRLLDRAPGFQPTSLLDLGCGPGTASWAALEAFTGIEAATLVDSSPHFLTAATTLAAGHPVLAGANMVRGHLASPPLGPFDLVTVSYALTELPDPAAVIERIWKSTGGALVIIEPGRPRDYERLMLVRERLIALGGNVAAPCPHHEPCPLVAPDWCHFSVRLARSRDHMRMKGATLGYEDEKYSYLAVVRDPATIESRPARVLAPPYHNKFEIGLKLCTPSGALEHGRVAKRDQEAFRGARKLEWGDALGD